MEQQEYFLRMQMLGQEAERTEQQIQAIDAQINEMNAVRASVEAIREGNGKKEILANLGKGIFAKADLREKDRELFVNIGKDTIIRKTPEDTLKIIDEQLKRLAEGRGSLILNIQELQGNMQKILLEMQKGEKGKKTGGKQDKNHECKCKPGEECECGEDCECENGDCECEDECKCGHKQ